MVLIFLGFFLRWVANSTGYMPLRGEETFFIVNIQSRIHWWCSILYFNNCSAIASYVLVNQLVYPLSFIWFIYSVSISHIYLIQLLSLLPARVLRLLEWVGFSGDRVSYSYWSITDFMPLVFFHTSWKYKKNRFSDVFSGCGKKPVGWNRLINLFYPNPNIG